MKLLKTIVKQTFKTLNGWKITYIHRLKIKKMIKNNPQLKKERSREYIKKINEFWNKELGYKIKPDWHIAYSSVNGIRDQRYISEDIFYRFIVPKLNRLDLAPAYRDKNITSFFLRNIIEPKTILRNIHSNYYDADFNRLTIEEAENKLLKYDKEIVIKSSIESGGGKAVQIGKVQEGSILINDNILNFIKLEELFKSDFLVQEKIEQNEVLNEIYPYSLNTIRIISLKLDQKVNILSAVIRFGNNGSQIDNVSVGGISCGINENGFFNDFAVDVNGKKYSEHPFTNISFKGRMISNYSELKIIVNNLHEQLYYFNLVSWDFGLDKEGRFVLIEMNLGFQGINLHQFNNGPLFKELTERVCNLNNK